MFFLFVDNWSVMGSGEDEDRRYRQSLGCIYFLLALNVIFVGLGAFFVGYLLALFRFV
ncbi:MAG TPA: hypothetical protein ACQGQH_10010 [Xylella sp.]